MKLLPCLLATLLLTCVSGHSAETNDPALFTGVKQAKVSLAEAVAQAEKETGVAISAKFEVEDGKFWLSVYTAKTGVKNDAEHNELIELKGEATGASWQPATEVFEDKKHLTRSAMHLTLVQVSKLSLSEAIKKGQAAGAGTVYSAIPAVKDGRPVYALKIATTQGRSQDLLIDGQSGSVVK